MQFNPKIFLHKCISYNCVAFFHRCAFLAVLPAKYNFSQKFLRLNNDSDLRLSNLFGIKRVTFFYILYKCLNRIIG